MTMKFFTREWTHGELDDATAERIAERYADHLAELWDRLPSTVRQFVDEVNLHDGLIQLVAFDPGEKELALTVRAGDEQEGYFDVTLRYFDVAIAPADLDVLNAAQSDPEREMLYDELDADGPGRFVHRILFSPDGEVEITFETLRSVRTNVPTRKK